MSPHSSLSGQAIAICILLALTVGPIVAIKYDAIREGWRAAKRDSWSLRQSAGRR